jgi:DNA-binding FadR family transcriptional regulator
VNFKPIRAKRAFEEVAGQVRTLVSEGTLKPGDRLPPERLLAQQLAVSRSALREALRGLEVSGVIERRKGKTGGAFIKRADPSAISDGMADLLTLGNIPWSYLTEARMWIEEIVVRVACERATEEDIDALWENIATVQALYKRGKFLEKGLKNIEFHDVLARATKNPVLVAMARTMNDVMRAFAARLGADPTRVVSGSRAKFMAALEARDVPVAIKENARTMLATHRVYERLARMAQSRSDKAPEPRSGTKKRNRSTVGPNGASQRARVQ